MSLSSRAAARPRASARQRPRWMALTLSAAILAVPFLIMIAVLDGMTVALAVFHGTDEISYQYPTILQFSRHLPFPELHRYPAAQTPFFHLLMAYVGKLTGYQLWRLRLVQVLLSYLLVLAVLRLLLRHLAMTLVQATVLALLFELSPYVFGQSFRLVTDNLALLFLILALDAFESFRARRRLGAFVLGCALSALAVLTRQSTALLWGIAALYLLFPGGPMLLRTRLVALGALVLSVAPAAALFLNWHGLVPVGGDPSSCGLCVAKGHGHGLSTGGLEVQTAELALAAIGFYGLVMFLPFLGDWLVSLRRDPAQLVKLAAGVAAGVVLLLAFPAVPGVHAAGTIWKVAAKLPAPDGTSLLFWGLVPAAGALLAVRITRARQPFLVGALALCFLLSDVAVRYPWEKYTDPLALLIVIATVGVRQLSQARRLWGVALLAAFFIAYVADTGSHGAALPTGTPAAMVTQTPR